MKNIYKFSLTILAVVIAMAGAWAMHVKKNDNKKVIATYYYHYKGNDANLSSYQLQTNWELVQSPTEPGCSGDQLPCVVESTQSTIPSFVNSITQESDVTDNTIAKKNVQ